MVLPLPPKSKKRVRKHLSADALYALIGDRFARVPDPRRPGSPIPLRDALMSAFAMFSLKGPSLLAFDERRGDGNLSEGLILHLDVVGNPARGGVVETGDLFGHAPRAYSPGVATRPRLQRRHCRDDSGTCLVPLEERV